MAVAVANVGANGGQGNITLSFTVPSGDDRLLLVSSAQRAAITAFSTGTFDGTSFLGNQVAVIENTAASGNNQRHSKLWRVVAPPVKTADVVLNNSQEHAFCVVTFTGVDQTTPLGTAATAQATGSSSSVSPASDSGDLVYDHGSGNGADQAAGTGQNQEARGHASSNRTVAICSTKAGAATSTTMSWTGLSGTGVGNSQIGVAIKPAGGGEPEPDVIEPTPLVLGFQLIAPAALLHARVAPSTLVLGLELQSPTALVRLHPDTLTLGLGLQAPTVALTRLHPATLTLGFALPVVTVIADTLVTPATLPLGFVLQTPTVTSGEPPAVTLTNIDPNSGARGATGLVLTLTGTGFLGGGG